MEDVRQPRDRREIMLQNVRTGAREQATPEFRENYLRSCAAHGGDMIEIVAMVRSEFPLDIQPELRIMGGETYEI